jgi:hypothetical protein
VRPAGSRHDDDRVVVRAVGELTQRDGDLFRDHGASLQAGHAAAPESSTPVPGWVVQVGWAGRHRPAMPGPGIPGRAAYRSGGRVRPALVTIQPTFTKPERLALAGFLARYRGLTR